MTSDQIQLIRETFALVAPGADAAALVFYKRLFELDATLRPLFRGDIEKQAGKLMQMLAAAIRLLDRPESLVPVLEDLGRRHVGYGARDEHYDAVGEALLWMLGESLGRHWTPAVRDAWTNLYAVVAATMKRAAAEASHLTSARPRRRETTAVEP
ncbi:MAG TPA: globin family protein [Haliangiales bacterium]|nr:globin family protein [Haliangiales bacterium]